MILLMRQTLNLKYIVVYVYSSICKKNHPEQFEEIKKYIPKLIKQKIRKFTEEDPYGEEDWD